MLAFRQASPNHVDTCLDLLAGYLRAAQQRDRLEPGAIDLSLQALRENVEQFTTEPAPRGPVNTGR